MLWPKGFILSGAEFGIEVELIQAAGGGTDCSLERLTNTKTYTDHLSWCSGKLPSLLTVDGGIGNR